MMRTHSHLNLFLNGSGSRFNKKNNNNKPCSKQLSKKNWEKHDLLELSLINLVLDTLEEEIASGKIYGAGSSQSEANTIKRVLEKLELDPEKSPEE